MIKKYQFSLMLSTMLCIASPVIAMDGFELEPTNKRFVTPTLNIEFEPTNNPISFKKRSHLKITTDHNNLATYQAMSKLYSVIPRQRLVVSYDFDVEQGIISLGVLNTQGNGWYFTDKGDQDELICSKGQHKGKITWIVPEGETTASLILRNYCLDNNGGPGQSIFVVKNVKMAIQDNNPPIFMKTVKFEPTNNPIFFTENFHTHLKITTDDNDLANYQAISSPYSVTPGQRLKVNYHFDVEQGIISLGALNTQGNGWYLADIGDQGELICSKGQHKGKITWIVPAGEKTVSFVLRNYFLGSNGQSIFKVKNVKIEVPDFSDLPGDLWIAIATNFLDSNGRKNLSRVSRQCMKLTDKVTTYLWLGQKEISAPQGLNDLERIDFLNRLSKLILCLGYSSGIPSHTLSALTNLKHLSLRNNNGIINDQHIAPLTNLASLFLQQAQAIKGRSLNGLTKLTKLSVEESPNVAVQDEHIDQLTNLTDLSLADSQKVGDNALQKLTNLERLYLGRPSKATDLSLLTKLKKLNATLESLTKDLRMLTRLEELGLDKSAVSLNDTVPYLTNLTKLCALNASTIDFIYPLTKLRNLVVFGNSPLNGLSCLTNLTSLRLSDNTSITDICNFSSLETLGLVDNPPTYIHNLPNLKHVEFQNTSVLTNDLYLEGLSSNITKH